MIGTAMVRRSSARWQSVWPSHHVAVVVRVVVGLVEVVAKVVVRVKVRVVVGFVIARTAWAIPVRNPRAGAAPLLTVVVARRLQS